jgi:hypothetical protein
MKIKELGEMVKNAKLGRKIRILGDVLILVDVAQKGAELYKKFIKPKFMKKDPVIPEQANEAQ